MEITSKDTMCSVGLCPDFGSELERAHLRCGPAIGCLARRGRHEVRPTSPIYSITVAVSVLLPTCLGDNFVSDVFRHRIIMCEFHRVVGTSAGHRTEVVHIAEHFGKGNMAPHHMHRPTAFHTQNSSTAPINVTNYITVEFFRSGHFHQHN